RSLEIDDQLVLGRVLHWQLRRLLPAENAIDVVGCAPVIVAWVRTVRQQPAAIGPVAERVHRGQAVLRRQSDDELALRRRPRARRHKQSAVWLARERDNVAFDLVGVAQIDRRELEAE